MRLVVWNMNHGKIREKLDLLWQEAKFDMAVLLEIDDKAWTVPGDGVWEDHVDSRGYSRAQGIRIWHKPEVTAEPLKMPDLSGVSIARAYRVTPPAGAAFVFVAYWAVAFPTPSDIERHCKDPALARIRIAEYEAHRRYHDGIREHLERKKKPGDGYYLEMCGLLEHCRKRFCGDLLIAGDTNLNADEVRELNTRLAEFPGARLLPASDGGVPGKVLGAEKQPCDTLLHCGKWWPCDLGIASETLVKRVKVSAGDWRTWIKPVGEEKVGSDHLPVFFDF